MADASSARVMIVDGSPHARAVIAGCLKQLGCQIVEAGERSQVLAAVVESPPKLILMEIGLPDGSTRDLLADLRRYPELAGTRAILVSTEVNLDLIVPFVELGISDFILKPFPAPEFFSKINKVLNLWKGTVPEEHAKLALHWSSEALQGAPTIGEDGTPTEPVAAEMAPAPAPVTAYVTMPSASTDGGATDAEAQKAHDILVIDDIPNVAKRLRDLVPSSLAVDTCATGDEALQMARLRNYRLVLIDMQMRDVDAGMLLRQMSLFQTNASFIALGLRTSPTLLEDARTLGFDSVITKPFEPAKVAELVDRHFETKDKVLVNENIITLANPPAANDRLVEYFYRIGSDIRPALEAVADACFAEAIVNAPEMRGTRKSVIEVLVKIKDIATNLGLEIYLVVPPEVVTYTKEFVETRNLRIYNSLDEAQMAIQEQK